jgi:hypothetical protein
MSEMTPAKRVFLETLVRLIKGLATALETYIKASS